MSVKQPLLPLPLLTDNIKMDRIPTKIKWKIHTFLHCISSFEGILTKIQQPDLLFLFAFISFYISRFHISPIFHATISDKKSPPPLHLLKGQNPLSVTKVFIDAPLHNKVALLRRDVLSREHKIVTKEFLERFYLTIYI